MSDGRRYAIYFTPHPDTALWRFGCAVLGYDALVGATCPLLRCPASTRAGARRWLWSRRFTGYTQG